MGAKREQAMVGLFVLIAGGLMVATVFVLSGAFAGAASTYRAYVPFAGGIEPGTTVRYAGTPKVGRVEKIQLDPKNPSRIEITFSVRAGLPVKTDSHVKIMSLSPLAENHLEILAGTEKAGLAPPGSVLTCDPYVDFNALTADLNEITPKAEELLQSLNDRADDLKLTVNRVNDLLNDKNRANLTGTLADARGMIAENRPQLKSTIGNLNRASEKIEPLVQDLRNTSAQANEALNHIDGLVSENRPDIRAEVQELRLALANVTSLTGRLDQTLDVNSDNIDELLENMRHVTQNLKEFTNTIKTRPYTLIRSNNPREHKTGERQ